MNTWERIQSDPEVDRSLKHLYFENQKKVFQLSELEVHELDQV